MAGFTPHFGYVPLPDENAKFVASLPYPHLGEDCPWMMGPREERDVFLWKPLLQLEPKWERVQQSIGDCVSQGAELVATLLLAQQAVAGECEWITTVASEPIYGGCRVEVNGGRSPIRGDGATGAWAAKWLREYGVLLRINYGDQTGNPDHDLRVYSGQRAKSYGDAGCGGPRDNGELDKIAKQYPVKEVSQVRTVEEMAAAIDRGCPCTIASNVGFGACKRDSDGIVRKSGSWAHQMAVIGLRYRSGEPQFRIANSWGASASGSDPGVDDEWISKCSWWCVPSDMEAVLRADDSYAFSKVEGFALPPYNFETELLV